MCTHVYRRTLAGAERAETMLCRECTYIDVYVCVYVYVHVYANAYAYVHVYVYLHTYHDGGGEGSDDAL